LGGGSLPPTRLIDLVGHAIAILMNAIIAILAHDHLHEAEWQCTPPVCTEPLE
jgi:hypothetical protein